MNVVVTGATGFVGGHLVEALLARGDTVTALVRDAGRARDLARRGVRLVVGGFDQPGLLREAVTGQQIVYHVAGATAARSEAEFLVTNRDATANLLAAIGTARPRLVLVSSLAAGGPTEPGHPLRGDEPPRPVTQYGRSKLAGEAVVRAGSVPWTIVRPPAVYGPGDREMLRVFRAARTGLAPVFGTGGQRLSLIYGPELAAALVAAGTTEATAGGTYYAAHAEELTSRQLVEIVGTVVGRRPLIVPLPAAVGKALLWLTDSTARLAGRTTLLTVDKAAEFLAPAWLADAAPLTAATGWRASVDFATGALRTAEWYRHQGWL